MHDLAESLLHTPVGGSISPESGGAHPYVLTVTISNWYYRPMLQANEDRKNVAEKGYGLSG